MSEFILKNGEKVEVGDKIIRYTLSYGLFGEVLTSKETITINERTIPDLIKSGILIEVDHKQTGYKIPLNMDFYIDKIAEKLGCRIEEAFDYINSIDQISPSAALSIVLKEIAIELDKKYPDHIENSPEIYAISMFSGKIIRINKSHIKNYKNFAAFRSIEDAKIACKIVKHVLKNLFKNKDEK